MILESIVNDLESSLRSSVDKNHFGVIVKNADCERLLTAAKLLVKVHTEIDKGFGVDLKLVCDIDKCLGYTKNTA